MSRLPDQSDNRTKSGEPRQPPTAASPQGGAVGFSERDLEDDVHEERPKPKGYVHGPFRGLTDAETEEIVEMLTRAVRTGR